MLTLRPRHNASGTVFGEEYICEVKGPPSTHQATLIVNRQICWVLINSVACFGCRLLFWISTKNVVIKCMLIIQSIKKFWTLTRQGCNKQGHSDHHIRVRSRYLSSNQSHLQFSVCPDIFPYVMCVVGSVDMSHSSLPTIWLCFHIFASISFVWEEMASIDIVDIPSVTSCWVVLKKKVESVGTLDWCCNPHYFNNHDGVAMPIHPIDFLVTEIGRANDH